MFDVLTINVTTELFGLIFCLVCISISALSPNIGGTNAKRQVDIRNMFICEAFALFSDAVAGIYRGEPGIVARIAVYIGNFVQFTASYMLFGFYIVFITHSILTEKGRLYSVTSRADIEKSAGVFVDQMGSLVYTLLIAGTVIFIVVMYLMMGVMIDRSSFGISLIKIFGYRPKEVRSLYLNGNLTIISVGALVCIPLAKFLMDCIYPGFIPNVACLMVLDFPPYLYLIIYGAILLVYFVSSAMLTRKLNRITPAEVLKNRE